MRIAQPPEFLSKRLNGVIGLAMHQRQRGRLKLKTTKVSQSPKVEMTYLECASTVQPHGNASNRLHRVYTPSCQCGRIKFEPINVSPVQNGRNTHLTRADAAQPYGSPPQCSYRVHRPRHRRGWLKTGPTNISWMPKYNKAYEGLYKPICLLPLDPVDPAWSISIGNLLYSLQNLKKSLQNISCNNNKSITLNTHLGANAINNMQHAHRSHMTYQIW